MRIALISDELTSQALYLEDRVCIKNVTSLNYKLVLKYWKSDILFVESAWRGYKNKWKFQIAAYPKHPKRSNKNLVKLVNYAKKLNIPTIFWNKEDGVHFDRFIDSAKYFDYIFTVDENCIPKYKKHVGENITVNTLMFAVQSKLHNFTGFNVTDNAACFIGSYSKHIHEKRRFWQDMMFESSSNICGLSIFDRNSDRKSSNYRYPNLENIDVYPAVSYEATAKIYKNHLISLNVNTIEDSPTMFSRRLVEIIACGGVAITNNTPAVERYFKDYCYCIDTKDELEILLHRFKSYGLTSADKKKLESGAKYVLENHTWAHRIQQIKEVIGL